MRPVSSPFTLLLTSFLVCAACGNERAAFASEITNSPSSTEIMPSPAVRQESQKSESFFNREQSVIFDKMKHEVEDYFTFMDPDEADPPSSLPGLMLAWSDQDKNKVKAILETILHRTPGLILAAGAGKKISVYRVSFTNPAERFTLAAAQSGALLIPQHFFDDEKPLRSLTHELIHLADASNRYSFSPQWASFANPIIERVKQAKVDMNSQRGAKLSLQLNREGSGRISKKAILLWGLAEYRRKRFSCGDFRRLFFRISFGEQLSF